MRPKSAIFAEHNDPRRGREKGEDMAVEAKRKCGYRKVGGLYLVAPPFAFSCDRGEIPLTVCPCCSEGIKQSRGWTWIEPRNLFGVHMIPATQEEIDDLETPLGGSLEEGAEITTYCPDCARGCLLCTPPSDERHGLLWVGEKFYSAADFVQEADELGISKRIASVPRGFELGKTIVYFAHPKAIERPPQVPEFGEDPGDPEYVPGIFCAFRPLAVEKIVTESEAKNDVEMKRLKKAGITPVAVPDGDPDHR